MSGQQLRRQFIAWPGNAVMRFTWVHLTDLADDVLDLLDRTIHPASAA